jgi:hypothetical protein
MELDSLIGPDESDGQAAAQFASSRLVADPTIEAGPQDMEFCF